MNSLYNNMSDETSFKITFWSDDNDFFQGITTSHSSIIFIEKGKVNIKFPGEEDKKFKEGDIFLLPPGIKCHYSTSSNIKAILLHVEDLEKICYNYFAYKTIPQKDIYNLLFYTLHTDASIRLWLSYMEAYFKDNKCEPSLIEIKTHELLFLFKSRYPAEKMALFFAPIMQEEYKFMQQVLDSYTQVKTANELARLCNYNFVTFDKKFRKIFGKPPYRWMLEKKASKVYQEIYQTTTPLKIIADQFGFSSVSQLSDFCKKQLTLSPTMIRKQKIVKLNE